MDNPTTKELVDSRERTWIVLVWFSKRQCFTLSSSVFRADVCVSRSGIRIVCVVGCRSLLCLLVLSLSVSLFTPGCILWGWAAGWCLWRRQRRSGCSPCQWRMWNGSRWSCHCLGSSPQTSSRWTLDLLGRPVGDLGEEQIIIVFLAYIGHLVSIPESLLICFCYVTNISLTGFL